MAVKDDFPEYPSLLADKLEIDSWALACLNRSKALERQISQEEDDEIRGMLQEERRKAEVARLKLRLLSAQADVTLCTMELAEYDPDLMRKMKEAEAEDDFGDLDPFEKKTHFA